MPVRDSQIALPDKAIVHLPTPRGVGSVLLAILIVSGLAEMAYGIVNFSAMPVYIRALNLDIRWVSAVAAGYLVAEGLLKSPFGVLGDRVGRKPLMLAGPIVSTVTALLTPLIHHPVPLIALRVLDGMGLAALWPSAFSMIGDYVPENRRASAMSLFNVAYLVGIALGPLIGGVINDAAHTYLGMSVAHSKVASFYVAAVLFALTAVIAILALPGGKAAATPQAVQNSESHTVHLSDFRGMLRQIPALLAMTFVNFLGVGCVMTYAKLFLMEQFDLTESQFGGLLLGPALIIALASIPLGTLGDRIGKATATKIGLGLCVVGYWLVIAFPTKIALVGLGSVIGIGFVIAFPAIMALVSDVCRPEQRGAAVGTVGTAQGLGAILGVAASGFLYRQHTLHLAGITVPRHGLPFLVCAIMLTIGFLIALVGLKSPSRV